MQPMTTPTRPAADTGFALVTDSTCDLGPADLRNMNVTSLPLTVTLQGRRYQDWTELDPETLYDRMRAGHQATTEPPSVEAFMRAYRPHLDAGRDVLSLHLSASISDTAGHARQAAKELGAADRVTVFDSRMASAGLAELLIAAASHRDRHLSVQQATQALETLRGNIHAEFVVPNLEYLQRGGRLSRAAQVLGNLTGMRPVLGFENGSIAARRRVRVNTAEQDLVRHLEQHAQGRPVNVTVYHAGRDPERLQDLQNAVKRSSLQVRRGRLQLLGCVIGAHVGPGAYGFMISPTDAP